LIVSYQTDITLINNFILFSSINFDSILLTGASGFLGKSLLKSLKSKHVITLARNNSDINADIINIDCHIPSIDLVIHAAGKAHLNPTNEFEKRLFFDINVKGTKKLLDCLDNSNSFPKSFVYISSVSVYGLNIGNNIDENTLLNAKDPYGKSKIQAENLVTKWCNEHNVICTILRLPLVVGSNPPGNLGSMINGIKKGFYFNIAGGVARKSMVLDSDVAKHILKAAAVGGIYNLTDGYHPTIFELSNHLATQLGRRTPMNLPYWLAKFISFGGDIIGASAPIDSLRLSKITSDLTFDDAKARKAFDWSPTPVLNGFNVSDNN